MSALDTAGSLRALDPESDGLIEARRKRASIAFGGAREQLPALTSATLFLVAVGVLATFASGRAFDPAVVAVFVATYALASRIEFEVGIGSAIPTQLVFVPMLFVLPPAAVPLCVAAGLFAGNLPDYVRGRRHLQRALLQLHGAWHAVGPAAVVLAMGEPAPGGAAWLMIAAAFGAQVGGEALATGGYAKFALGIAPSSQFRQMRVVYLIDAALIPMGVVLAVVAVNQPLALAAVVPLLALLAYFARERRVRIDHALELSSAYRGTALLLGDVVEADHEYTGSHSRDVVDLVLGVADDLGLDARDRRDAEFAALLHDVGKIRIPQEIIDKPGKLTPEERAVIETHTLIGEQLLERVGGVLGGVGRIVRSCHERWDGAGYPDRLMADEIPLVARIVCAADAFSAMTTDRPYRAARTSDEAIEELRRCAGTQFDPLVVASLTRVVSGR